MASNMMEFFKTILLVQLFYAFAITMLAASLPPDTLNHVDIFSDVASQYNLNDVGQEVQQSLERQTDIPIIELGALIFYSGNILIDLLLNFIFAIPQMLGLIVNGLMLLFNIDSQLFIIVELFAGVVVTVMYFVGIIQLLTSIKSGVGVT